MSGNCKLVIKKKERICSFIDEGKWKPIPIFEHLPIRKGGPVNFRTGAPLLSVKGNIK